MMPGYPGAPGGAQDYDMATLYGMADHSTGFLYPEEWHDGVVEHAEYGRSKDGSKGQWTVKFRTTTGANAGRAPITTTLSISPVKNDGQPNAAGLGILFRHLAALGVPVPDPAEPSKALNGQAPYWVMGWDNNQVASAMIGRPVYIKIKHDEYDGVTRNKIADIRPPRPNAPTTWPQQQAQQAAAGTYNPAQQPQYGQPAGSPYGPQQGSWGQPPAQQPQQGGFAPQPWQPQQPQQSGPWNPAAAGDPSATQPTQGAPNQWQQPGQYQQPQQPPVQYQAYGPGGGGGGYPQPGPTPGGTGQPQPGAGGGAGGGGGQWQQPPGPAQGGPGYGPQQGQPPVPGAPPWAQPGQPGFGGTGEFTQQGQSQQPQYGQPGPVPQPPWQQQPQQPQQGQPPQQPPNPQDPSQGGQPGQPPAPWM